MKKLLTKGMLPSMLILTSVLATACPPPTPPAAVNWSFQAASVTVNESQDEVRDPIFGACISLTGCTDEPYVLIVNFRVKLGVANSAQTWVTGQRDSIGSTGPGGTVNIANGSAASAKATFSNVQPVDVLEVVTGSGAIEILGSYVFALETDTVGVGSAASGTANVLKDALNSTIAAGTVPSDLSQLLDLLLDNIGSAFGILGANIPLFGLGDDVMGGGLYVGLGVTGELANIVNGAIGSTPFPNIAIPVVDLPPDITDGGFYTTSTSKTFSKRWNCCGGGHTWNFLAGAA